MKRKKVGTPEGSPQGKADIPNMPTAAPRTAKTTVLGGLFNANRINTLESTKVFLKGQGALKDDKAIDIPIICAALSALIEFPLKSTTTLTDGIKSICLILKDMVDNPSIAEDSHCNDPIIKELADQKATLARLETTIIKMASDSQGELKELKKGLEESRDSIDAFKHRAAGPSPFEMPPLSATAYTKAAKPSYAAAVIRNSEQQHASAIAKGNDRERQVVLTIKDELVMKKILHLTTNELIAKGDLALEMMAKDGVPVPKGAAFVFASTTRKGAVVYQINSKSAADWLKSGDRLETFAANMGSVDAAHACLFYVLLKFVPVTFAPDDRLGRNCVESNNSLPMDAIQHARYIKAPIRRKPNQRTAHVIIGFNSREIANQVIENGLLIENARVRAEKLLREPTRCFNGQSVKGDHRAGECPHTAPTCARCAGVHRTVECTHMGPPRCVNCQKDGHSAADRECATFEQSLARYHRFTPDARYRFYPIAEDTHTWEPHEFDHLQEISPVRSWASTAQNNIGTPAQAPTRPTHNEDSRMQEDDDNMNEGQRTPRPQQVTTAAFRWWADDEDGEELGRLGPIDGTKPTGTLPSRASPQ